MAGGSPKSGVGGAAGTEGRKDIANDWVLVVVVQPLEIAKAIRIASQWDR
jgi:hypothetical protein